MIFNCSVWIRYADQPVSLVTGSTAFKVTSNDWIEALSFIREKKRLKILLLFHGGIMDTGYGL
jgi:hypothetical protein